MTLVRVTSCRKCYVLERRFHHGLAGLLCMAAGLVAVLHDRRDFPWRLRDR